MAAALAGCASPGYGPSAAPAPGSAGATAPAAPPPVAPPPAAPPEPQPVTPASIQSAQRLALAAVELLEGGNEEQASVEIQRSLQADPNNKLALSLLKQIQSDPQTLLGRESFTYRVQPGESLSSIAKKFLGDVHQFYILARYNDIKVPRQLQGGQQIRVPGKAPPPTAAPAPAPAPARAPSPPPAATPAPAPAGPASAAVPENKAERDRQAKITAATRAARAAFARQDLATAIRNWDSVLELEPDNKTAQLERQRAIDLRERLNKVK